MKKIKSRENKTRRSSRVNKGVPQNRYRGIFVQKNVKKFRIIGHKGEILSTWMTHGMIPITFEVKDGQMSQLSHIMVAVRIALHKLYFASAKNVSSSSADYLQDMDSKLIEEWF